MYHAACADAAAVVDFGSGIYYSALAECDAGADICLGVYAYAGGDGSAGADIGESAHIDVVGEGDAIGDEAGLLDAAWSGREGRGGHLEQSRECLVGVVDADECGGDGLLGLEVAAHQHYRCPCIVDMMGVLGVGKESDGAGCGFFDFCKGRYCSLGISLDGAADHGCYLIGFKFHECII